MDERIWTDRPLKVGEVIEYSSSTVSRGAGLSAQIVSGNLDAARKVMARGAPVVGLLGDTDDGAHIVRIARDRALFVSPGKPAKQAWYKAGYAVSQASDLYVPIDILGTTARIVLGQGTSVDLNTPSPSAAVRFFGHTALLVRRVAGYRLLVEASWLTVYSTYFRQLRDDL